VRFEWKDSKRRENLKKHAIDFRDIEEIFRGTTVTLLDARFDYAEERFISFGSLRGAIIAVAHTEDEETIRIISARKATKSEEGEYFKKVGNSLVPPEEDRG